MKAIPKTIRTSKPGWFAELSAAYHHQLDVIVIDDAKTGINLKDDTLWQTAQKAKLSYADLAGALVNLGVSAAGVAIIAAAFFDPEPTSKLGLLVASGLVLTFTGGWGAIRILTKTKPPQVSVSTKLGEFTLSWA